MCFSFTFNSFFQGRLPFLSPFFCVYFFSFFLLFARLKFVGEDGFFGLVVSFFFTFHFFLSSFSFTFSPLYYPPLFL